jgi:DNA-directed RNA polymerase subunit RPC12/RpoP
MTIRCDDEIECPYCGHMNEPDPPRITDTAMDCEKCEKHFRFYSEATITYYSSKIDGEE